MEAAEILTKLQSTFPDKVTETVTENPDPYVVIDRSALREIAQFTKAEAELDFDFLESICGVDFGDKMQLVYHLLSYKHRHGLVLKTDVPYDDPAVATVSDVWPAAEWHEREQFDLFGIRFDDHRDLRRLLLPEDWVGHPLRKNYVYPDAYHGIDHYRPDPKDQFKALDELVLKARAKAKAAENKAAEAKIPDQVSEADRATKTDGATEPAASAAANAAVETKSEPAAAPASTVAQKSEPVAAAPAAAQNDSAEPSYDEAGGEKQKSGPPSDGK